jgi:hypothetical protein
MSQPDAILHRPIINDVLMEGLTLGIAQAIV